MRVKTDRQIDRDDVEYISDPLFSTFNKNRAFNGLFSLFFRLPDSRLPKGNIYCY